MTHSNHSARAAREFNQLILLLHRDRGGDSCHGCGRPYRDRDVTNVGYDRWGKAMQVGSCCIDSLTSIIAFGAYFATWADIERECRERAPPH
jgi:hypothetical protein